jgi:hypothetical protein
MTVQSLLVSARRCAFERLTRPRGRSDAGRDLRRFCDAPSPTLKGGASARLGGRRRAGAAAPAPYDPRDFFGYGPL